MPHYTKGTKTASASSSGTTNTVTLQPNLTQTGQSLSPDNCGFVGVNGTFTSAKLQVEALALDGNWYPVAAFTYGNYQQQTNPFSLTNSTAAGFLVPLPPQCQGLRAWFQTGTITSGNIVIQTDNVPSGIMDVLSITSTGLTGPTTINATSTQALVVAQSGTTSPAFQVNDSTLGTGWQITSAAAASGVDLKVLSSGTNESATIEAKGTGSLTLNGTTACTGAVQIGGAASGNNATGLTITPNAASSGLAVAVVSTAGAENLTIDALGTGTITLNGTATGVVTIGNGLTMADAKNIAVGTSTGTKIGTSTSQKLALWNATPIVQPANTVDYVTGLVNVGLRASGGTASATFPGKVSVGLNLGVVAFTGDVYGAANTIDVTKGYHVIAASHTTSATSTYTPSGAGTAGDILTIVTETDGSGTCTITFASTFHSSGTQACTMSTFSSIIFQSDGTRWVELCRTTALA